MFSIYKNGKNSNRQVTDTALCGSGAARAFILLIGFGGGSGGYFSLVDLQHSNCFLNLSNILNYLLNEHI